MDQDNNLIALQASPLNVDAAMVAVGDGDGGAIAVFVGRTRRETNPQGKHLTALDYEAYREMAEAQLHRLADEAHRRWKICRLVMIHRIGRVEIEQPSVLVAVLTPHRAEAFEACRFLIDSLKAEATIWKQEIWDDGSASWVEGREK